MKKSWSLVGSRWPEIRATASALHTNGLIRVIKEHVSQEGYNVNLQFVSPHVINEHTELLREQGIKCYQCAPNTSSFDEFLKEEKPDVVLFDRFIMEEQFAWKLNPETFRILDTQDLHFLRAARREFTKQNSKIAPEYPGIPVNNINLVRELSSIHRSDLVLVVSSFERDYLITTYGIQAEKIQIAPFWYETSKLEKEPPKIDTRKHFMMIGNFLHPPNIDALEWSSKSLWTKIRAEIPGAELHVYGAYPTKHAKGFHKPENGLYVHGPVASLEPLFAKFRVNFAPLRFGAGIKGKITDGWYHGVPCITTRIGAEGLNPKNEFGGIIANSELEIICAAKTLMNDETEWTKHVYTGQNIIKRHFSMEITGKAFAQELMEKISQKETLRASNLIGSLLSYNNNRATEYFSRYIQAKNENITMKQNLHTNSYEFVDKNK